MVRSWFWSWAAWVSFQLNLSPGLWPQENYPSSLSFGFLSGKVEKRVTRWLWDC